MELDKIHRVARLQERKIIEDLVPNGGDIPTGYQSGGSEHDAGHGGHIVGPGPVPRPGSSLLPGGDENGSPRNVSERKQPQSTFHVEYQHEEEQSPRSHYEKEFRTIVINLDHP